VKNAEIEKGKARRIIINCEI